MPKCICGIEENPLYSYPLRGDLMGTGLCRRCLRDAEVGIDVKARATKLKICRECEFYSEIAVCKWGGDPDICGRSKK